MAIKTYDLYIPLGPRALPRHLRVPFFSGLPHEETIHDSTDSGTNVCADNFINSVEAGLLPAFLLN